MENETILDGENFRSNPETFTYKEIVMSQLNRVVVNASQEMRKGFWIYSHLPSQSPEKIKYIGDSKKELKQSIDCLHDLLLPKFDKDMKDQSEKLNKEYKGYWDKIKDRQTTPEKQAEYWEDILEIYRKLFQQLSLFLDRQGWLQSKEVHD